MQTLHQSVVLESEIDELGHLSVPFYEARALTASRKLVSDCGLDLQALAEQRLELTLVDAFSRNLREQFLGASLAVQGGALTLTENRIQLYQQIVNTERDELAAVYAQSLELQSIESRATNAFPGPMLESLSAEIIGWPEQGRPRSLNLESQPYQLALEEAQRRDLAARPPRKIELEECNEQGFLESDRFQHLPYSGPGSEDPILQWVFELDDGRRVGLADLETRNTLLALPRAGDRIQVFSAEVALARKTLQRSHWVFNLESGALLSTGSVVMACLDLDARRALEMSGALREMFERRYHPDLA